MLHVDVRVDDGEVGDLLQEEQMRQSVVHLMVAEGHNIGYITFSLAVLVLIYTGLHFVGKQEKTRKFFYITPGSRLTPAAGKN